MLPHITVEPAWCTVTYSYTLSDEVGDHAVTFDDDLRQFSFFNDDKLELSGAVSKDYTVTLTVRSG